MKRWLETVRAVAVKDGGLPIAWLALTIVVLFPVWHQRLLPMLDTPNHLALVRAWHSFNDPSYKISDYYSLRIRPVPYLLFYATLHFMMFVTSVEVANKIFLSVYLILFPLSVLSLAKALKRSPWLALGAFALAFNQNWIYGFSSYLMGTCFMFFSWALLIRYLAEGGRLRVALLCVSTLLAYLGHVMPWFCIGLGGIAILILDWRRWRRGLVAAAAMLPSLLLAIAMYLQERQDRTYMKQGDGFAASWRDFPTLVIEFPRRIMELFPGVFDYAVLGIITACVIAVYFTRVRGGASTDAHSERQLKWLLILLALTYLTLPYQITKPLYWWFISPRVPSMMAPLILLWPRGPIEGWRRLLLIPMVAACLALPIKLGILYRDFSNRNLAVMRLLAEVPRGANTLVVVRGMMRGPNPEEKSGDPATSGPVYWHFSSWPMALNGGYDPYLFDQGIPVRPKVMLKAPTWSTADTFDIRQAPEFDYYLVRLPMDSMQREPSLKLVDELGEWSLFHRMYPLTDEP